MCIRDSQKTADDLPGCGSHGLGRLQNAWGYLQQTVLKMCIRDRPSDAWYAGAVNWSASRGIVTGYSTGAFGPEDAVTREQLSLIHIFPIRIPLSPPKLRYLSVAEFFIQYESGALPA